IVDTKVLVDGEAFDHGVTKQGQLVTLEMTREVLDEIAGKELTLEITAQIKDGTPIEVIDNQANIQVNDNPKKDSNIVPVTPPPTTPVVDKDVEGTDHLDIDFDKEYKYNIVTALPKTIDQYEKLIITDKVDEGLEVIDAVVTVDGEEYEGIE